MPAKTAKAYIVTIDGYPAHYWKDHLFWAGGRSSPVTMFATRKQAAGVVRRNVREKMERGFNTIPHYRVMRLTPRD